MLPVEREPQYRNLHKTNKHCKNAYKCANGDNGWDGNKINSTDKQYETGKTGRENNNQNGKQIKGAGE